MPEVKVSRGEATRLVKEFLGTLGDSGWLLHVYYSRKKFRLEPRKSVELYAGKKPT